MQGKSLLLICGSQVFMSLTKKILEREGYSVRCALGFAEAKEHLMDFTPNGIIVENDLPDGRGIDYCREFRKKSATPVMLLSNVKEDELPSLQSGANDFLKKPYDNNIMTARVGIMLNAEPVITPTVNDEKKTEYNTSIVEDPKLAISHNQINQNTISKASYLFITAAAFIFFTLMGVSMFRNNSTYIDLPDEQVPLGELLFQVDKNSKPYTGTDQGIILPKIDDITLYAVSTDANITLSNPKDNPCYLVFEIVMNNTEESLYTSGMVAPGMCVDQIALSRSLPKGYHHVNIEIRAYAPDGFTVISNASVKTCLTSV